MSVVNSTWQRRPRYVLASPLLWLFTERSQVYVSIPLAFWILGASMQVSRKALVVVVYSYISGAEGGIRTHTPVKVADFKSAASTIPPPRPAPCCKVYPSI